MKYKIEKGPVPSETRGRLRSEAVRTFDSCEIGESFVVKTQRERNAVYQHAHRNGKKVKTVHSEGKWRIFKIGN